MHSHPSPRPLAGNRRESMAKLVINIQIQNKIRKNNVF